MSIVDKFNRIGNEFAVSSDGIATALQSSASALMSANNDLESSIALVAAANRVVQDESEVGAALRTISLRLRGTSVTELEELGEETEGVVESVSKLQNKLLGLTGVNILNDDGSYKSTYEILLAISEVFSTLDDQSQAATLELIAGKNRSNVASALLTNTKDLKDAYEAASNAEGSAAKELNTYLSSIEGRVSQFNNAVQAMWNDTLNSDVVKFFVDLGTKLVKLVDAVGPLNIALVGLFTYLGKQHGLFSGLFKPAEESLESLQRKLTEAQADLNSATQKFEQTGSAEDLAEKKAQEQRVNDISKKIQERTAPVDPELDAMIGDRDILSQEVDALKARREELKKAVESDSPDDLLRLVEIDTESIDNEIAETKNKLESAKQDLLNAQAEPAYKKVNGGIRSNHERDQHIADASQEIADIEKELDALQQKKVDVVHYAAQFDLVEMDGAIDEASDKLNGMTDAINAKTAATSAGVVVDQAAEDAQEAKIATTWKELAAQIMSGEVTKDNIGANIKSILVTKLATTALGEKIAAILGVTTAELVNIPVTQLLTAGFSALASAIWAVLAPLLPFIAVAAGAVVAVVALAKVIDAVWVTAGEAKEKLEELNSEVNNLESDLESLNSELKTTQERMEELLSKDSLSFIEQEELNNLKLQNEYLERQIELQELILKNKKAERTSVAKDVIDKTWDSKSFGKEDYQVDWDDGVIKKDNFWSVGVSGKDAINKGIERYNEQKEIIAEFERLYKNALETGSDDIDFYEKQVEIEKDLLTKQAGGIDMVLGDMSNIIAENELQYGDDKEINKYLDEYYAMSLKWQEAQGAASKSDIIKSIFNTASSDATQELKKQLDEIAASNDDAASKQTQAQKLIQDAVNGTNTDYQRLKITMEALDLSAEELAKSFIDVSSGPNISTMQGMTDVYEDGLDILRKYKDDRDAILGQDEDGNDITWNNLFKTDIDGKKVADSLKVASILEGSDAEIRAEFTKIAEAIENGELETKEQIDAAIKGFGTRGIGKALKIMTDELGAQNIEIFPGLKEEIEGIIDKFDEFAAAVGDTVSAMDTLEQARAEEAYSGSVSIETLENLMKYTENYADLVEVDETGAIRLAADAEEILINTRLEKIKADAQAAVLTAQNTLEQARYNQQAVNESGPVQEALTKATDWLAGSWAYLGSLINDVKAGNFNGMGERAQAAYDNTTTNRANSRDQSKVNVNVSVEDAEKALNNALNQQKIANALTPENIKKKYDSNEASGGNKTEDEVKDDAFQKEMDYWENRIGANRAKYEQLQNEIDLLEAKGQKADASFYEEQIELENERKWLLEQQKAEALARLQAIEDAGNEGSESWWEVANVLNDIEGELDDVTASIVDLQDAIGEIDAYKFDEFNTRLDNLTSKLGTIRDLIAPDGEEDWFDDQGSWTDAGIAVAGTYLQELETYKQGYQEIMAELAKYESPYAGNEEYYASLGIHSEQEYYDKTEELISQQYDFAESINDTEQSIVDMYESSIDAVEKYVDTLIDGYNDYIDSVKEALDAERDLYDFKKNVQKQAKDIAEIERRIASLSGSTNKADIAERRKLEAQLYESRESLDDAYYDHAKDAQNDALDAEASAYEETMTKMVEGMRTSLQEATADMDTFLNNVTIAVSMNADTVLAKYKETNVYLDPALTNPWENAKTKVGEYGDKATNLMDVWKKDGYFAEFSSTAESNLSSPWSNGTDAANTFKNSVSTVMSDVVSNISTNVQAASGELSKLYQQIKDTEARAASANVTVAGSGSATGASTGSYVAPKQYHVTATLAMSGKTLQVTKSNEGASKAKSLAQQAILGEYEKYQKSKGISMDSYESSWLKTYRSKVKYDTQYYAKGTTGTKRDEWAVTDEPQFGDELVLVPGKDGNLSFMRKGTSVVPADITQKLLELTQIPTSDLMNKNLTAIVPNVTKNDFKNEFNFDSLVHVDTVDSDTLPKLEKMVDKKIDDFSKALNYSIKRFAR